MTYNLLSNLQFCGDIVNSTLPLLYYTHIPASVVALFVGFYVLYQTRTTTGYILFGLACVFSVWSCLNLLIWLTYDQNTLMITVWSAFGLMSGLLLLLTHWFAHTLITERPLPLWMAVIWGIAFVPIIVLTPTALNLSGVDIRNCVATENQFFTDYYYSLGCLAIILTLISAYLGLRANRGSSEARSSKLLVLVGSLLFIGGFVVTGVVASYLVDSGLIPDFGLEQYGVATMTIFMAILAYATVRYHAFNLKLLAAQALVFSLVILIAAEFLFVSSNLNRVLVGITLAFAGIFGYLLVRSVKTEVKQRELIEKQEQELEVINKQQENLLHFISHEVKGYLTESQAGFAAIIEGDFGVVPAKVKEVAEGALVGVRRGVSTVMEILDASNLKKGTMAFAKKPFDMKHTTLDVLKELKPAADEKHLTIEAHITDGQYMLWGDEEKIHRHVIQNLIDNAIKYTPAGTIEVSLTDGDKKIRFSVKDSGVGISQEDMSHLFTEGGHGKDSIKVNVHSTGYGLYIAKQIVDVHKGKIWAETSGVGKGSKFIVEFPAS